MPELPEVETIRRDLENVLIRRKITSLDLRLGKHNLKELSFLHEKILGQKFLEISRRGKLLIFHLLNGDFLLIHLKMTGQLIYQDKKNKLAGGHSLGKKKEIPSFEKAVGGELPNSHTRAIFSFQGAGKLFFNDMRRFGYLRVVKSDDLKIILEKNYGPEPLSQNFNFTYFSEILKKSNLKIKAFLLDQKRLAGLGNIYVDESLFASGILPQRTAKSLKKEEIRNLLKEIKRIIEKALKYRGTTFSDFRDLDGKKGNFSNFLQVYGRPGQKCFKCGKAILKTKLAGRGTHYCANCQK